MGQGQTEGREPSSEGGSHFESGRRCRQVWPGSHCLPQAPLPQPGQPQVIPPAVPWQALPEGPWGYRTGGATAYALTQLQTALWPVLSRREAFWPSRHLARSLHHLPSHWGPPTLVWPLGSAPAAALSAGLPLGFCRTAWDAGQTGAQPEAVVDGALGPSVPPAHPAAQHPVLVGCPHSPTRCRSPGPRCAGARPTGRSR